MFNDDLKNVMNRISLILINQHTEYTKKINDKNM